MHKTFLATLGISSSMFAAQNQECLPEPGAPCYPDECTNCYCLGPATVMANSSVCPYTCNGDISITVAGLYWVAHEDGLEYAIDNQVRNDVTGSEADSYEESIFPFNHLVEADYLTPNFKWDFGFRLGLAYCNPCDGWDIGVYWTWFKPRASSHVEAEQDDNHVLISLWSAFASPPGNVLYATDIETKWSLDLNLIDLELGRNFWTSKYLSIRPFVGLRIAFLDQAYKIEYKGGSWGDIPATGDGLTFLGFGAQDPLNNEINLHNDFQGVGLRTGLNSNWHLGCGWAIYSDMAASIVYGRFKIDHDEFNRLATEGHEKIRVLQLEDSFRASRAIIDLGLGLQWMGMVCDCKYGLLVSLGWEQHLFFHQNQLWRTVRIGDLGNGDGRPDNAANDTGENVFHQRRGNLDTQGITLRVKFDF